MGLFNKLKNALFEEEEINLEPTPDKVVINDDSVTKKKEVVETKKEIPLENERELFKAENTFNFPDFDEEEFVTSYEPVKKELPEEKAVVNRKPDYDTLRKKSLEYEQKPKITRENPKRREKPVAEKETTSKKSFHPSPVISPVYGILDKNYKKEDFLASESRTKRRSTDVDMARKKAFGSLEEDIEKTLDAPKEEFFRRDTKSIDDLLKDTIDETIELKYEDKEDLPEEKTVELKEFSNRIEEELDTQNENLEIVEALPKRSEKNEKYLEENTLESDLFDLIDSMYDSREEE